MSTSQAYEEKKLLLRIADGDEVAFRHLFDHYRAPLFRFAVEITKSSADAEDIIQDVFIKIWEQRARMAALEHARPYIYAITRNATFDFLKKVAKSDDLVMQVWANAGDSDIASVEAQLAVKEKQAAIREAVSRLSPVRQQVFRMSREKGMSLEEIAAHLSLSRSRVKNLLVECLKFLRDYLAHFTLLFPLCADLQLVLSLLKKYI